MSKGKTLQTSELPSHAGKRLLVDVDNVTVRYGGETVLDNVSFCIHRGEFVGVVGQNGAGKTTLLRTVLGLQGPDEGRVDTDDAAIGYIAQQRSQYSGIVPVSVLEVVLLGAKGDKAKALAALRSVGLEGFEHRVFGSLSGGQQQRVSIARALAAGADMMILDEPTTGIDERSQAEFYDLLRGLREKGITIVIVSHEVDAVLTLVTRVICLNRSILYDGPPESFEMDKHMPSFYKERHFRLHHHHEEARHA